MLSDYREINAAEVLTPVVMKCTVFWDVTAYSSVSSVELHGVISRKTVHVLLPN
jgi:hypothetical protein